MHDARVAPVTAAAAVASGAPQACASAPPAPRVAVPTFALTAMAGCTAEALTFPIDALKTRMQLAGAAVRSTALDRLLSPPQPRQLAHAAGSASNLARVPAPELPQAAGPAVETR